MWWCVFWMVKVCVGLKIFTDTWTTTEDPALKPPGTTQVVAVSHPIQVPWINFREGAAFVDTNQGCQQQAYLNGTHGWSFVPLKKDVVLDYSDEVWYGEHGVCRLFYRSSDPPFYLYSRGYKWAHELIHSEEDQDYTCPRNSSKFVGVQIEELEKNRFSYNYPAPTRTADFCFLSGEATPACQTVPIKVQGGRRIVLVNDTISDPNPVFCSTYYNACGAREQLYTRLGEMMREYSTVDTDGTWEHMCYVWSKDHCN